MNPSPLLTILLASCPRLSPCLPQGLVVAPTSTALPTIAGTPPPLPTQPTLSILPTLPTQPPVISRFHVTSRIQLRYARTVVDSLVTNPDPVAQQADFAMVIPDSAFISNFSMEVGGKEFVARVEEKEAAEKRFDMAVNRGQGAGLVSQDTRDSNRFIVSANVEGRQNITFRLTYDELLDHKAGLYEQAINIHLKEIVEDFKVEVLIEESLPITVIKVPELLESNELDFTEEAVNSIAEIDWKVGGDDRKAKIVFAPSMEEQEAAEDQAVSGQLVVRYDVDRHGQDSEVQVIDGYFVHYFVPENLETLPKHAIFILDTSGSMSGEKIQQLKDAMFTVLDATKPTDFFTIITFSSTVVQWTANGGEGSDAVPATEANKKAAIQYVLDLEAGGGTNINAAILAGLEVAGRVTRAEILPRGLATILVFLSDGEPTEGETSAANIKTNIATANSHLKLPIFSVAFGRGADFDLLKDISQATDSFAKRVYEDSDAALQLENFYTEISSPLITNLKFDYVGELVDNSSLSDTQLNTFFKGNQYMVVGKLLEAETGSLEVRVTGDRSGDSYSDVIHICLRKPQGLSEEIVESGVPHCLPPSPPPPRSQAQEFMQSLHAFLNIHQLLKKDMKQEALSLALRNNFVTPLTSLVVVRPGEEDRLAGLDYEIDIPTESFQLKSVAYSYSAPSYPQSRFKTKTYNSGTTSTRRYAPPRPANIQGLRTAARPAPNQYVDNGGSSSGSGFELASVQYDSFDDYYYADDTSYTSTSTTTTTTTTTPSTCSGSLTLYSSTYHRGANTTLLSDTSDLSTFSDQAVSATVSGSCCWQLYAHPAYAGVTVRIHPGGTYRNTDSFGRDLFREVSSVRKVNCT